MASVQCARLPYYVYNLIGFFCSNNFTSYQTQDWVLHHHQKFKITVSTWNKQFHSVESTRLIVFLWLCNDIIQVSNRSGASHFKTEFQKYLPAALKYMNLKCPESDKPKALRVLSVWETRGIFSSDWVEKMKSVFAKKSGLLGSDNGMTTSTQVLRSSPVGFGMEGSGLPKSSDPLIDAIVLMENTGTQNALLAVKVEGPIARIVKALDDVASGAQQEDKLPSAQTISSSRDTLRTHLDNLGSQIEKREFLISLLQHRITQEQKKQEKAKLNMEVP